jgi:hypothetical protein
MSAYANPPLGVPRRRAAAPKAVPALPKWGWLEWFAISQTVLPAMLFIPGITPVRVVLRVSAFITALFCWGMIVRKGKILPGADTFPANIWLKLVLGWLAIMIFHPGGNSLLAAFAQAILYLSILSPAFWAPAVLISPRQIGRIMTILFVCNALSAAVGLGQVFRPGTFNPPVIPALMRYDSNFMDGALVYTDTYGNKIIRPCGLTDQIGNAANAGATAALIGLSLALRPGKLLRRGVYLGAAFVGVAVIYYSQVRLALVMLTVCLIGMVITYVLQKNYQYALKLAIGSAMTIMGAFSWVAATSGDVVIKRFLTLTDGNLAGTVMTARGMFVQHALTELLWQHPVGYGMGWYGQVYDYFGSKVLNNGIWSEVMFSAWIFDGGAPLLLFYGLALTSALWSSFRIALNTTDRDLAFWATVVLASNLAIVATCFSFMTFIAPIGIQFWLTSSALYAADLRVRNRLAAQRAQARAGRRANPGQPPAGGPRPSMPHA